MKGPPKGHLIRATVVLGALGLLAAACGDDSAGRATTEPAETADAGESDPDASPVGGSAGDAAGDPADDSAGPSEASSADVLAATAAEGWTLTTIGTGIKPVLAMNPDDVPGMAFLDERLREGYVSYASAADGWAIDTFVEGYFYGPIGLSYAPTGEPHIVYHDHQSSEFDLELGDLTHAVSDGSAWQVTAAADDGHDGWDSVIAIGDDGVVRAAGIDPSQFGSTDGVEYYELVDGGWEVTSVSEGEPVAYEFNVDLEVGPDGRPALTYFLDLPQDLVYASRADDGSWQREVVDAEGDVGRYSSLALDGSGAAHIAYWDATNLQVKYATDVGGDWTTQAVAPLAAVEPGQEGARRIVSVAVDSTGLPTIAFSDTTGIWLARLDGTGWSLEPLVTADSRPLGQLVSMALDADDTVHLAFFEVTGNFPLAGLIGYLTDG